jgi:hypothetical protein
MKESRIFPILQLLSGVIGAWILVMGLAIFPNDIARSLPFLVAGIGLPAVVAWSRTWVIKKKKSG